MIKFVYKPYRRNSNKETNIKELIGEIIKDYDKMVLIKSEDGIIRTVNKSEILRREEIWIKFVRL